MAKRRYRFNPETLSYEQHGVSFRERFTRFIAYFSSSLAFSIVLVIVILNFYETPEAKHLEGKTSVFDPVQADEKGHGND
jgi:hypothetical protein